MATTATLSAQPLDDRSADLTATIVISSGATGGALAPKVIPTPPEAIGMKLDEVEIIGGTSTSKLTVRNSRGTIIWELAALVAGEKKIYGGHRTQGIFPKMDSRWTIETDGFSSNDQVTVLLKFTRFNG